MDQAKKTKGRRKLEMKKIENEKARYVAFAKRKSGIYNKASEITTLCGAKVDILLFSPTGKSFCYGDPSLELMTRSRSDEENPQKGCIYHKLVEERKKLEIVELNEKSDELMDQTYDEKEREKKLEEILKTRNRCGWWETKIEELSYEQVKEIEASLVDLQKKLTNELSTKRGENSSHAPIDQTNGVNPHSTYANISEVALDANNEAFGIGASESFLPDFSFSPTIIEEQTVPIVHTNGVNPYLTYPSGSDTSEVAFGANNEAYNGIGESESLLPDFSFSPTNEEQRFNLIPYDESGRDLFDYVIPPKNQANGNGSGESAFANCFLPTNQAQGVNLTNVSGCGSHALAFSPSNQFQGQGDNSFIFNANNENADKSGTHDLAFFPSNQHQEANPYLYNASDENGGFSFHPFIFNADGHVGTSKS